MDDLSPETRKVVDRLFPREQLEVCEVLARECGKNLPLTGPPVSPRTHDRIRLAVLKLSEGDLTKLRELVRRANRDWRDVLVWAGFGNSLTAHEEWARTILNEPRAP